MATGKKELTLVMVAMAMVVMSSMGGGVDAAPSFPLECSSFVFGEHIQPQRFCCIDVQDQFLLKKLKTVGIGGLCKAVTKVKLNSGPLVGKDLDLALSIWCQLSGYYKKGYKCAGKVIPRGI